MIGLGTSDSLLDRGERIGVASECEDGEREGALGIGGVGKVAEKICRAGFGVEEFVEGFYIRIIEIRDGIENC